MSQIGAVPGLQLYLSGARTTTERAGAGQLLFPDRLPGGLQVGDTISAAVVKVTATEALLDIKGQQVVVAPQAGLVAGAEVQVRVAGLTPQAILELVAPTRPPEGAPPAAFEVGQTLTARVLDRLPDGRLSMDVAGGPRLEAEAPPGIEPGAVLSLQVEETGPRVVLRVVDQQPALDQEAVNLVRESLPDNRPVGESLTALETALQVLGSSAEGDTSLAKLQTLLRSMVPEGVPPQAEQIHAWVRNGGLHFEAKLADAAARNDARAFTQAADRDVKGLLLQALQELQGPRAAAPDAGAVDSLVRHLHSIEAQQGTNVLSQLRHEPIQLQVPFSLGQRLGTAALSIEPDASEQGRGQGGQGAKGYSVLFFLDLEGLGQTRVDAYVADNGLRVSFFSDRGDSLAKIRGELPALREALQGLGFREVVLSAQPASAMPPDRRLRLTAAAGGIPLSGRLVDARA